jgi:hypothetical protein
MKNPKHPGRPRNPTDLVGFAEDAATARNFAEMNRLNTRLIRGLKSFDPDELPSPQKRGQMHPSIRLFYWLKGKGDAANDDDDRVSSTRLYIEAAKCLNVAVESAVRNQRDMAQLAVKVKQMQHAGALKAPVVDDFTKDEMEYMERGVAAGGDIDELIAEVLAAREVTNGETPDAEQD